MSRAGTIAPNRIDSPHDTFGNVPICRDEDRLAICPTPALSADEDDIDEFDDDDFDDEFDDDFEEDFDDDFDDDLDEDAEESDEDAGSGFSPCEVEDGK